MWHRARCRRPGAFGFSVRDERSRQWDLVLVDQARARRPTLSRILRIPPGPRSADGTRGAVGESRPTSSVPCGSSCRITLACVRPGCCGLGSSSTTISAAANCCRRPGRLDLRTDVTGKPLAPGRFTKGFEYSDCEVDDARLVVLNARDAAERGADDPHPDSRGRSASARRALASHGRRHFHGRAQHDFRAGADQCRWPLGARSPGRQDRRQRPRQRSPGAGLAHRRAEAVRPRPRLHPAERRRPHRLHNSLSGRLSR